MNLKNLSGLSSKATNICRRANFKNKQDIVKFVFNGGDIYSLKGISLVSGNEIHGFIKKDLKSHETHLEKTFLNNVKSIFSNDVKKELFIVDVESRQKNLSVRAKNALVNFITYQPEKWEYFINQTINEEFSFSDIKNVGKGASLELDKFRSHVIKLISKYSNKEFTKEDLIIKKLEKLLSTKFEINSIPNKNNELNFENNSFDFKHLLISKEVDLIQFFDYFIIDSKIFKNDIEKLLFKRYLNSDDKKLKELGDVAKILNKSRERVRQINRKFINELNLRPFYELIPYCHEYLQKALNDSYSKIDLFHDTTQKRLKYLEYDSITLTRILGLITHHHFKIDSGEELKAFNNGRGVYNLDFYKSNRKIKDNHVFSKDFIHRDVCLEILNEVFNRNTGMVKKDYFYNPFSNFNLNTKQKEFIVKLTTENFNCSYSDKGFLIKRNTVITIDELVEKALNDADEPLLLKEIYERLEILFPGKCKSEEALRGTLSGNNKTKFIYLRGARGRKTIYGLREWEKTKNLKAGSIKHLCIDYLKAKENPVHLLELSRFIMKHRETNASNILSNLKLDPHNNFIYFKSSFIGLKTKNYNKTIINSYKSLGGFGTGKIMSYIKNNIYYDYDLLVEKFSKSSDIYPIQVEQSIINGIENDVLKQKGERIYYNSIQEDSIIKKIFNSEDNTKISGHNPYKISIDDNKSLFRVKQSLSNHVNLFEKDFQYSGFYDNRYYSESRCLLVYNPSLSKYRAYTWHDTIDLSKIKMSFKFNIENEFSIIKIDTSTNIVDFSGSKTKKFLSFLNVLLDSDMSYEDYIIEGKSINLDYIDLENISELNAISRITNEALKKYNIELDISESREIYQRIKLSKS